MPRKVTLEKDLEAAQVCAGLCLCLCGEAPSVGKIGRRWVVACVNATCRRPGYGTGSTWQAAVEAYISSLPKGRARK